MNVPLEESDLRVGKAVPWPVYSADGRLLLAEGTVVETPRLIQGLLARGAVRFVDEEEAPPERPSPEKAPIAAVALIQQELAEVLKAIDEGNCTTLASLYRLIDETQRIAWVNSDAALGWVQLNQEAPYTEVHPIMCGVISELLGRRLGLDDACRTSVVGAALTSNVGMLKLQELLANQSTPLTDAQKKAVLTHPVESVALLEKAGVTDPLWLSVVAAHHEKLDGTGYPQKLEGDRIPQEARLVSLADIYSAMILPRQHREGLHAQDAIRSVFAERGKTVDETLAGMLIKELGVYPVGAFVKLTNGEVGVVVKRGTARADRPIVCSLVSPRGGHYESPPRRDTATKDVYKIRQVVARDLDLTIDFQLFWGGRQTVGEPETEQSSAA